MTKYEVIIYWSQEDEAFVAEVPQLAGCAAHGDSQEEALRNAQEAIQSWLATAKEFGDPIPEPISRRLVLPGRGTISGNSTPFNQSYNWLLQLKLQRLIKIHSVMGGLTLHFRAETDPMSDLRLYAYRSWRFLSSDDQIIAAFDDLTELPESDDREVKATSLLRETIGVALQVPVDPDFVLLPPVTGSHLGALVKKVNVSSSGDIQIVFESNHRFEIWVAGNSNFQWAFSDQITTIGAGGMPEAAPNTQAPWPVLL